jgi:hypothetical protein
MKKGFEYTEDVKEFTGLIFHCPKCDATFHLHIAHVELEPLPKVKVTT